MEISYKTLNKTLRIGAPIIEIPVEVFEGVDITHGPKGYYVELPSITLQAQAGHRFLQCFLHGRTNAELLLCSGKSARGELDVTEKTFAPTEGRVRRVMYLDFHLTEKPATHTMQVALRGKGTMNWTQSRSRIPVLHINEYEVLLTQVVQEGRRPERDSKEHINEALGDALTTASKDNVIHLKTPRRPVDPDYKWVRGMRVRV